MLVNQEQPKVWNRNALYCGDEQLLNNKFVCHFHFLDWLINTSNKHTYTHRNTHSMRPAEWMQRLEERLERCSIVFAWKVPIDGRLRDILHDILHSLATN